MEWVETTGRTVAEAKDAALDELGVDEADAEFEVLAEPQHGLFGRLRSEARVRARVRPTTPRAKDERRNRSRRDRAEGRAAKAAPASGSEAPGADRPAARTGAAASRSGAASADPSDGPEDDQNGDEQSASAGARRRRHRGGHRPGESPSTAERARAEDGGEDRNQVKGAEVEVDLDHQAEVAVDFLTKLVAEFGLQATTTLAHPDPETVEVQLSGPDLGILIGPKGQTLIAVQNLTRTAVFNETGGNNGHINVDISGYRQKRNEALARFAEQAADHVKSSGQRTALEPMSSIDRKIVHDTIAGIDGVSTISEGEEPRRRVVVLPG